MAEVETYADVALMFAIVLGLAVLALAIISLRLVSG